MGAVLEGLRGESSIVYICRQTGAGLKHDWVIRSYTESHAKRNEINVGAHLWVCPLGGTRRSPPTEIVH
jgi:hypothetical protein